MSQNLKHEDRLLQQGGVATAPPPAAVAQHKPLAPTVSSVMDNVPFLDLPVGHRLKPPIGQWLYFWRGLNRDQAWPVPAQVIAYGKTGLNLNIHDFGGITAETNVQYSAEPKGAHWSKMQ